MIRAARMLLLGVVGGSLAGGQAVAQRMGMRMAGDSAFAADMAIVHELLMDHDAITRTVTLLPRGIRTVTESADPRIAAYIIQHVARMEQRLQDGSVFNVASPTLPTIFANADGIRTEIQLTAKGAVLTQTADDSATVAALQAHAAEVSALVAEGMVAMRRSMMAAGGPMGGMGMMGGGRHRHGPMMGPMRQRGDSAR